jgi:hypothetical protein
LSALAEHAGDHEAAVTLLQQAMEKPGGSGTGRGDPRPAAPDDPLWTYVEWGGRDADTLLAQAGAAR